MDSNTIYTVLYMVLIVGIFYFLWYRPQQTQRKRVRDMIEHLSVGDRVMTAGGLIGSLRAIQADTVTIEIAEGVVVQFTKRAIVEKLVEPVDAKPE